MSKERRAVTLDPEIDTYLASEGINASQLVNRLVKNHKTAGGDEYTMLKLREQQVESEIEELHSRIDAKRDELELIQEQLDEYEEEQDELIDEAADAIDPHIRTPDNPAVENWADIVGVTPDELVRRLEELND